MTWWLFGTGPWRLLGGLAVAVSIMSALAVWSPPAQAYVTDYCNARHSYSYDCYARRADGSLIIHTYNDTWLVVREGTGYFGCAMLETENGSEGFGQCGPSNTAYYYKDNTTTRLRAYVEHAACQCLLTLNGSAAY